MNIYGHHDTGQLCPCVRRHRPVPAELERHHVWPAAEGGPTAPDNVTWLCPTAHTNVHELLRIYKTHDGTPPYDVLRKFNRWTRHVADTGWRATRERRVIPL